MDILLKKFKHRLVEAVDPKMADALGLSRAILCNDLMSKLMDKLDGNLGFYRSMISTAEQMLRAHRELGQVQDELGTVFGEVAMHEEGHETKELLGSLSINHRAFAKEQQTLVGKVSEILDGLKIYAEKAVPDAKQSISRYMDAKVSSRVTSHKTYM